MAVDMAMAAAQLLDFSKPVDVPLLESVVDLASGPTDMRAPAEQLLLQYQEHPQAWQQVGSVLSQAQNERTKYFTLQVLESVVRFKWGALPMEQREEVRNFLSALIIRYASLEESFRKESTFINKLNIILVQILKHDWPQRWRSFIPDIVAASKTNETLCENTMKILRLLSEEVFDFSKLDLTQAKTKELKSSLNNEFRLIHDLCIFVLTNSRKMELVRATLDALNAYLSWVPLGYIFESNLVEILLQLFPQPAFRNVALQCLTEVGSLVTGPEFNNHFQVFYRVFIAQLSAIVPPTINIPEAYEKGTDDQQSFVQNLALFLTGFFKGHLQVLESSAENQQLLITGLEYLVSISHVDNIEIFKTCLDYWNYFVPDVYASCATIDSQVPWNFAIAASPPSTRKALYSGVLSKLRNLMVCRMAKPEEVLVVEDENGNIVRETMKDNDVLQQYKSMRETLVYLCHLDQEDTEMQMLEKLHQQMSGPSKWTWNGLNTLCWAIGSISGSMQEEQENRFLVTVIRDLLNLCEVTRGKDNKAVIASNIMYVVGQYPKFLRAHWKFLKTVINKLFEFMHETHPGVQDMACDTFLKISNKCRRKFVVQQIQEHQPFISELLGNLNDTILDLQPHQIHIFYEAVGLMISAESEQPKRDEYLVRLMTPPNATWNQILLQARADTEVLKQTEAIKSIQNVLQTNIAVCTSIGHPYVLQFTVIFSDMLQVYKLYSEFINQAITEGGLNAARTSAVKYMISVRKVALRLIDVFVDKCEDALLIQNQVVRPMIDPVLGDYVRVLPDARDAEVLSVFASIINRLKTVMEPDLPIVFKALFEATLQMITHNFEDYPEHRLQFFALLHAVVKHCFRSVMQMSPQQLKLIIDSTIWACRHTERNIAETGLNLLMDLLAQFAQSEYATQFYQAFYVTILQEVFAIMTDSFHKPGFKMHARILHHLFGITSPTVITAPLWDPSAGAAYVSNDAYVREYVAKLLRTSFPNLGIQQVAACINGMFELKEFSAFKQHLRDFLIQTKQFASEDNAELFAEEVERDIAAQQQQQAGKLGMLSTGLIQQ